MKKAIFIITTVFIMLITSRFVIRIVDATVQIDNDIALLIILLIVLNVVIGMLSRFLYKKIFRGKACRFYYSKINFIVEQSKK